MTDPLKVLLSEAQFDALVAYVDKSVNTYIMLEKIDRRKMRPEALRMAYDGLRDSRDFLKRRLCGTF